MIKMLQSIYKFLKFKLIIQQQEKRKQIHFFNEKVKVGKHTYGINQNNIKFWDHGNNNITIGNYCSIASGVCFFSGGEHNYKNVSTFPFNTKFKLNLDINESFSKGNIYIGNDVWIGTDALILSGVVIGDGAVIGAKTIVTKDVPDYAIAIGNPMRIIKYRFNAEQIKKLKNIAWWNWEEEEIKNNIHLFYKDIEEFIDLFDDNI